MITIKKDRIENIPVLNLSLQERSDEKLPAVFFMHGFTSAKEHNLHYAYYLAEKGYRVLMPDSLLHGERGEGLNESRLSVRFWEVVVTTIEELGKLKDYYTQNGLIDEERIGAAGTSMGGIVTLGALTKYTWIQSAVSLMGCPSYTDLANAQIGSLKRKGYQLPYSDEQLNSLLDMLKGYDLTLQPEVLQGKSLFFWHGKQDTVVPYQPAYDFYSRLSESSKPQMKDLQFMTDETAGHKVSREAVLKSAAWFAENL
ncbi:prolyl oligopeptidase family serine peptidase [Rossellomorea vietnamensis]|uniref:Prolyl oligopeptidase family serine peptidase n=1 Tax=Rossellomorea aquimaris TaxID=189382 RepID=A0A5D4U7M8_9BACI|nr:prolyl oligopeptidase family serine peptidase [Rossellomorea aquimaris]TYS83356.1 prolyl oligopeptidase family serine peptidase [Rossellomorea aquimaris]